jgi:S1-C subfamily serine protease
VIRSGALAAAAGLTALTLAAAGCGGSSASSTTSSDAAPSPTTTSAAATFADVVDRVKSGVIRIEVAGCGGKGVGTGFLVEPRLIATVEHVVEGATRITLKRNGVTLGTAQVIGIDRDRDLALLRAKKPIKGYAFGFAGKAPRLGEEVGAIGFPLGLPLTVTRGSVSGLGRIIPIGGVKRRHLVQTDAAVNHGNSGGPLLSAETGEVVGLVDLGTNAAQGVAFAVSAEVASPLLKAWATAPQPPAKATCSDQSGRGGSVGGSASAVSVPDYADAIDAALIDSARTRGDLADLIDGVKTGTPGYGEARSEIHAIIDQRRSLLDAVTVVRPPAVFAVSARLLRVSLVSALDDDLAIESWIKPTYQGNDAAAARFWAQQLRLSEQTTQAKAAFLSSYNAKRRALLGLPPLEVIY